MGATSGIGLEVARLFHRDGHPVAIAGRRQENLQRISAELGNCPYAQIDVTAPNAPALLQGLIGQLGGMDIYLHVSGIGKQNRQLDTTIELSTVETNAMGFTRMINHAWHYFRTQGGRTHCRRHLHCRNKGYGCRTLIFRHQTLLQHLSAGLGTTGRHAGT